MDILSSNLGVYNDYGETLPSTFPLGALPLYLLKEKVVLDYGCGTGRALEHLMAVQAKEVWMCDASRKMCEIASKQSDRVFPINDPRNPGLPVEQFDGILLSGVISSVIPFCEREILLARLARLLKPNGTIIIGEFGRGESELYQTRYQNYEIEPFTFKTREGLYIHHFDIEELRCLLEPRFEISFERKVAAKTSHDRTLPGLIVAAALR